MDIHIVINSDFMHMQEVTNGGFTPVSSVMSLNAHPGQEIGNFESAITRVNTKAECYAHNLCLKFRRCDRCIGISR